MKQFEGQLQAYQASSACLDSFVTKAELQTTCGDMISHWDRQHAGTKTTLSGLQERLESLHEEAARKADTVALVSKQQCSQVTNDEYV